MEGALRATGVAMRRFRRLSRGLARKGPSLHPKFGNRLFNKGYGAPRAGRHTRRGNYEVDWHHRVPYYIVPDLTDCDLKPYVSPHTPKVDMPPPPMALLPAVIRDGLDEGLEEAKMRRKRWQWRIHRR